MAIRPDGMGFARTPVQYSKHRRGDSRIAPTECFAPTGVCGRFNRKVL
ncbi:hypothetical protein [Planktothricoides raciborskii]|nr:hypothetical protein [Planktothricoides raciborskii]